MTSLGKGGGLAAPDRAYPGWLGDTRYSRQHVTVEIHFHSPLSQPQKESSLRHGERVLNTVACKSVYNPESKMRPARSL